MTVGAGVALFVVCLCVLQYFALSSHFFYNVGFFTGIYVLKERDPLMETSYLKGHPFVHHYPQ